ncbi:MAG: hypothetical protein ABWZ82_00125 [Candidatus Limnocylindrales bacterium]
MTTVEATTDTPIASTPETASAKREHRLVLGARTALIMLLIAGVALFGIGVAALLLVDPPEVDGWLRSLFGTVFGYMAIAIGAIVGVPALVGVWAMAGANAEGATPALSRNVQRLMGGIAIATLVLAALVVLVAGSELRLLDLALIGIMALPTLGLAGAVRFSPHKGRAIVSALALLVIAAGICWLMFRAWQLVQR